MKHRAGIVLMNRNNELLLVQNVLNLKWSFPKGCIESNESIEECAKREFHEETGNILTDKESYIFSFNCNDCKYFVYLTSRNKSEFNLDIFDRKEIKSVQWFNKDSLNLIPCNQGVREYMKEYVNLELKPVYKLKKTHKPVKITDSDGWTTVVKK